MTTLTELLNELVDQMNVKPRPTLYTGVKSELNEVADEADFPLLMVCEPVTTEDDIGFTDNVVFDVMLMWGFKSDLEWPQSEHDKNCIIPARELSKKFLTALKGNSNIDKVLSSQRTNFINIFDVNMSGVIHMIKFRPVQSGSLCL